MVAASDHLFTAQEPIQTWEHRIASYCEHARIMSMNSLEIIKTARDEALATNLDLQYLWTVKALDGMKQAFQSAQWAYDAIATLPYAGVKFGTNQRQQVGSETETETEAETAISGCKFEDKTDYIGQDFKWIDQIDDKESCAALCALNGRCVAWTWVSDIFNPYHKRCHLKSSHSYRRVERANCCDSGTPCPRSHTARPEAPSPTRVTLNVDRRMISCGKWLGKYPDTATKCFNLILNNDDCVKTWFAWANHNDNNCWCATSEYCHTYAVGYASIWNGPIKQTATKDGNNGEGQVSQWLRKLNRVMINMVKFNDVFHNNILEATKRQNSLKTQGIKGWDAYQNRVWRKNGCCAGPCYDNYDAHLECYYNDNLHYESKGGVRDWNNPVKFAWTSRYFDNISHDSCKERVNHHSYRGNICEHNDYCGYLGNHDRQMDYWYLLLPFNMNVADWCNINARSGHDNRNDLYERALWWYRNDDFYRLQDSYLDVYWVGERGWNKYEKKPYKVWQTENYKQKLDDINNVRGMFITDLLYNGIIKAAKVHGFSVYGHKRTHITTYGSTSKSLSHANAYGRRGLTEEEVEVKNLIDTKNTDEILEMEDADPLLLDKLMMYGHVHAAPPEDYVAPEQPEFVMDESEKATLVNELNASDDDWSEEDEMDGGSAFVIVADGETVPVYNVDVDTVTVVEDDTVTVVDDDTVDDTIEEGTVVDDDTVDDQVGEANIDGLSGATSNLKIAQLAFCFMFGAGVMYFAKSHIQKESSNIGLLADDEI